ncbi:hypothetical protein [Burkholderia stagnalis]|uniref:hypothetical protein n=1 Tax=Burkholderia stagnalis TaxID=1503054 RepID=UPI000ACAF886|nr:hypothetical protein [Burkholderia stagnalis]
MVHLSPLVNRALQTSAIVISLATALASCSGDGDAASGAAVAKSLAAASQDFTIKDLGTLPGKNGSSAYAINDHGQVVGESNHAVLWTRP